MWVNDTIFQESRTRLLVNSITAAQEKLDSRDTQRLMMSVTLNPRTQQLTDLSARFTFSQIWWRQLPDAPCVMSSVTWQPSVGCQTLFSPIPLLRRSNHWCVVILTDATGVYMVWWTYSDIYNKLGVTFRREVKNKNKLEKAKCTTARWPQTSWPLKLHNWLSWWVDWWWLQLRLFGDQVTVTLITFKTILKNLVPHLLN